MKIKFKLFDFNKNDMTMIFIVCIYVMIYSLFVEKNDFRFLIYSTSIFLILRFFLIAYLKKKIKILILEDKIKIKSFFYKKDILYSNIKNLVIRKNDGYSFIICDVKNICEIENYILKKMNCYELKKKTYI